MAMCCTSWAREVLGSVLMKNKTRELNLVVLVYSGGRSFHSVLNSSAVTSQQVGLVLWKIKQALAAEGVF